MNRIKLLASLMVLVVALDQVRAEDKMVDSAYFPLKVGTAWTYRVANAPQSAPKVVVKVIKHEKVGDFLCARLESFVNGKVEANEYVAVTKSGVYRVSLNGFTVEPPVLLLKLPPNKGDNWKVDGKVGTEVMKGDASLTEEAITVPLGKYDTFKVLAKVEGGAQKIEIWTTTNFAKGVGNVRRRTYAGPGLNVFMDLEIFEEGK